MRNHKRACLTCKHVKFKVPDDWKPSYEGDAFNKYDARNVIRKMNMHLDAQCTLNPVWIKVPTQHYCGQWDGKKLERDVQEFIYGTDVDRRYTALHDENARLKASLKHARRISRSRLDRLKSNGGAKAVPEEADI